MNTAEMWIKARNDGKVYECIDGDIAYSKYMGLVDKDDFNRPWCLGAWDWEKQHGLDSLLNCKWQEMNVMTIEEAELKFGIKIIVVDEYKGHYCECCGQYITKEHLKVCDKCASEYEF